MNRRTILKSVGLLFGVDAVAAASVGVMPVIAIGNPRSLTEAEAKQFREM